MNSPFKIGDTVKVLGVKGLSRASVKIIGIREGVANGIELSEAVAGFRFWSHDDLVLVSSAEQGLHLRVVLLRPQTLSNL